jgi:hypothetical protein
MPAGFRLRAGGRQLKHEGTEIGRARPTDSDTQPCVPKDVATQTVLLAVVPVPTVGVRS